MLCNPCLFKLNKNMKHKICDNVLAIVFILKSSFMSEFIIELSFIFHMAMININILFKENFREIAMDCEDKYERLTSQLVYTCTDILEVTISG